MIDRPRIVVSFSGGLTSGFLSKWIRDHFSATHELLYVFANTGQEDERTLAFVDRCDREWGLGVVWLEAVVDHTGHGHGHGTRHRVTDYFSAHRGDAIFEDVIKKYGIPNATFKNCTRELKERPIHHYLKTQHWNRDPYRHAIGIRADEWDRVSDPNRFWYPLVSLGVKKGDIHSWWSVQPFHLNLPEHLGNCVTCWKKSYRKLMTITIERPEAFDFNRRMEREYRDAGAGDGGRVFFRGHLSTEDLFEMAKRPFRRFHDAQQLRVPFTDIGALPPVPESPEIDVGGSCGDSCEVGADETEESLEESWL